MKSNRVLYSATATEDQPFEGDAIWSPAGLDEKGVRFEGIEFEKRQLPAPDNYLCFRELSHLARLISCQAGCMGPYDSPAELVRVMAWFLNEPLSIVQAAWDELQAFKTARGP
jgi:hypothetical protein